MTKSRVLFFMGLFALMPLVGNATEFCAVNNFGKVGNCFPTAEMCRSWISRSLGDSCIIRQTEPQKAPDPSFWEILQEDARREEQHRAIEQEQQIEQQRELERERAKTHPKLLPLVGPNAYMSRETQTAIFSTLLRTLEMEPGSATRTWRNQETGSYGEVSVSAQSINQYGLPCRQFSISMIVQGGVRSTEGIACRKDGKWGLM